MEKILKKLLDDLAAVAESGNEEIFDTDVREQMFESVWLGYIVAKHGYKVPAKFGMFTEEANLQIRNALENFIQDANSFVFENSLRKPRERLKLIQNDEITGGREEITSEDFFGYIEYVSDCEARLIMTEA